jgi:hypothetical protein
MECAQRFRAWERRLGSAQACLRGGLKCSATAPASLASCRTSKAPSARKTKGMRHWRLPDKTGALGGVAILADGSNINPIALKILNMKTADGSYMLPTPQIVNTNLSFAVQGSSVFNPPCTFNEDQYMVNVDFLQTQKGKWEFRYFGANDYQENTIAAGNIPTLPKPIKTNFKNFSLAYAYVFSPRITNDVRVGWNFTDAPLEPTSPFRWSDLGVPVPVQSDDLPAITITGSFNLAASTPTRITQNSYNFVDSFSYLMGAHTIRLGGGVTNRRLNNTGGRQTAALTFQSFPDFLLGLPGGAIASGGNGTASSSVQQSFNQTVLFDRRYRQISSFLYAQDDWKISRQLTLNLGLRFERMPNYTDAFGRLSGFDLNRANRNAPTSGTLEGFVVASNYPGGTLPAGVTQLNNDYGLAGNDQNTFSPRVGLAWKVFPNSTRLVLRGGYGLYYTQPPALSLFMTGLTQPWSSNQTNPGKDFPSITFQNPFRAPLPSPSMLPLFQPYSPSTALSGNTYVAQNFRPAYTHQFSFNTQTELSRNYLLEVGYVGAHAEHLIRNRMANQAGLASAANPIRGITTNTSKNANQRAQVLGFITTGITQIESEGFSWYHGLQASLTKRYSSGFQFLASYTFSKSLDTDAANVVGISENRANIGNQLDPMGRYGRSSLDRSHRLIVNYMYDLKFFANTKGVVKKLLDGWSVAGVTILQSGSPLTVTATNTNNAFGITSDRAQLAAGCTGSQVQAAGPISGRLNGYFNKACFASYPIIGDDGIATAFGNGPVSITNGPRQNNTDFVFAKRTKVRETVNLEFRSEFFNVFNHPQFANPVTNSSAANFGQITALAVNPRFIQFALKLSF